MKLILNIILVLHLSQSFAQRQFDLTANFYSNTHLSEHGEYLVEYYSSGQTINTIHIKVPKIYLRIDSLGLYLDEMVITYIVWNIDTVLHISQTEIVKVKKGDIEIMSPDERPFLFFQGANYNYEEQYRKLFFCDRRSKWSMHLTYLSKKELTYNLYFLDNCDYVQKEKNIIRSGVIKLKKKNRYKPRYIHNNK